MTEPDSNPVLTEKMRRARDAAHRLLLAESRLAARRREVQEFEARAAATEDERVRLEGAELAVKEAEALVNELSHVGHGRFVVTEGVYNKQQVKLVLMRDDTIINGAGIIIAHSPLEPSRALVRASGWLGIVEVFVSPRVGREEIGDALEDLRRFEREGRPRWHLYAHAIVCAVLVLWHTWGDKVSALRRRGG